MLRGALGMTDSDRVKRGCGFVSDSEPHSQSIIAFPREA